MAEALGAQEAGGGASLVGKLRMADRDMVRWTDARGSLFMFLLCFSKIKYLIFYLAGAVRSSRRAGEDRQSQLLVFSAAHTLEVQQNPAYCF